MTKPYFRQVPNFEYISRNPGEKYISEYIPVKNLFKRGKLREDILGNLKFFEKYSIIGDERPDNVANKFYGDSTLDWVVLLSNNILNIQTEWPKAQSSFDKFLLDKYRNIDITSMNFLSEDYNRDEIESQRPLDDEAVIKVINGGIHHYETLEIKNSIGVTVLKEGIKISDRWRTNGNFLAMSNSKIESIQYNEITNTVEVDLQSFILTLKVGDQVQISNVSEVQYNGKHIVTGIFSEDTESKRVNKFGFNLPSVPNVVNPIMADPRKEEVLFTLPETSEVTANSYYYEYWDEGLGYSVQVPSSSFVRAVTNYEYELQLEEDKRNIFVLKPLYLNVIFNDLDDTMTYKKGSQQYVSENLKKGDNVRLYE